MTTPQEISNKQSPHISAALPVVRLRNATRRFAAGVVLDHLNIDIKAGEFVALLGRSGSGKTTLLRALAGLDKIDEGEITVPSACAAVFQEPRLMPWKRAWKNVALGVRKDNAAGLAQAALAEVGLAHRIHAWPVTLSGGEAQRVALARALVREPELLLLDEPFAALDALTRIKMHRLILQLWQKHLPAVLLVTHDVDEAILLADRILVLADGHIAEEIVVNIERPRDISDANFQLIRKRLLLRLGVDLDKDVEGLNPHDSATSLSSHPITVHREQQVQ